MTTACEARAKRGFRKLSFDEAFNEAELEVAIEEELNGPLTDYERQLLEGWRRESANKLSPAISQATSRLDALLRLEARAWMIAHNGMPNIGEFIRYFKALPDTKRRYSGGASRALTDDALRKRLKKLRLISAINWPRTTF